MLRCLLAAGAISTGAPLRTTDQVQSVLQRYVTDYSRDPRIQDVTFGIQVDARTWTIEARKAANGKRAFATLASGSPRIPTFVWKMTEATFNKIASGETSAITASGKARSSDPAPLELVNVNGFSPGSDWAQGVFRPLIHHFWTMGQPEVVRFGFDKSRVVHGGRAVPTLYAPGVRTSWYGLLKGDHINKDPRSQKDPWETAFFIIKGGTAQGRVGETIVKLESSTMIHVPPDTIHEFWNDGDVPAEMIMVTFGKDS